MRLTLNDLPACAFVILGISFLYGGLTMDASFSGSNQHRWVPVGASLFVILLSLIVLAVGLYRPHNNDDVTQISAGKFFGLVVPLLAFMAIYAQGQIFVGYVPASLAIGFGVFLLFGNSPFASLLHCVFATSLLYFIFFKMLRLYNPPGTLFDLPLPF